MKKLLLVLSALALTVTMSLAEGKCGEGKCGSSDGNKTTKKCGAEKAEKKCNASDKKAMKCNAGKCAGDKK